MTAANSLTSLLLAGIDHWLSIMATISGTHGTSLRNRLERAKAYLVDRANRATQTEATWPPVEIGGES